MASHIHLFLQSLFCVFFLLHGASHKAHAYPSDSHFQESKVSQCAFTQQTQLDISSPIPHSQHEHDTAPNAEDDDDDDIDITLPIIPYIHSQSFRSTLHSHTRYLPKRKTRPPRM
ncbi:MAG TPA: hypothetical protein DCE42_02215 [Myxococcales bacterium]|nr:hypothetical protein [Deltaproteobacteria bacterium]HAA53539.1 hypothetical protein [Myxococcales bacterium]